MRSLTAYHGPTEQGVAENTLMCDFLSDYFEKHFKLRDLVRLSLFAQRGILT
jgi:hypothetical protein